MNRTSDGTDSAVSGIRHKGYCTLLKASDVRWPEASRMTLDITETKGNSVTKSGKSIAWTSTVCVPKSRWNGKVIWYFHGLCGNGDFTSGDKTLGTLKIYEAFAGGKPIVVGLSLGDEWLLNDELDAAVWDVLKGVQKAKKLPREGNLLFGFSMGGFNALRLYGNPDAAIFFEKCVVVAPCLPGSSPYASREALRTYFQSTSGRKFFKKNVIHLARDFFPDAATWHNADPIGNPSRLAGKPLLILAGDQDIFGFNVTSKELADELGTDSVLFSGKHHIPADPTSVDAIVRFLE